MTQLEVHEITKQFPTPGEPLCILQGINFTLSQGESLAVVGPSGSGKSTLLAILGTLESPTSGHLQLAGHDPFQLSESKLAEFRRDHIGFVFQDHHLLPQCTVLENVLIPFLADGKAGNKEQTQARELLDRVGLADRLTHRPAELSGGERQRVAIARALVRKPTLLLADEPTGNLDRTTAEKISELLIDLPTQHNAILVVVTHSEALAARTQQQMELDAGKLVPIGTQ